MTYENALEHVLATTRARIAELHDLDTQRGLTPEEDAELETLLERSRTLRRAATH